MSLSPILSVIHTDTIGTMINCSGGSNGHGLKNVTCKQTFTWRHDAREHIHTKGIPLSTIAIFCRQEDGLTTELILAVTGRKRKVITRKSVAEYDMSSNVKAVTVQWSDREVLVRSNVS